MEDNSGEDEDDEAALLRALAMSKDTEAEGATTKPAENKEAPKEETELKDVISMDFLKDIIQDMNLDVDKEGLAEVA
jgi:hypothetical protein